MKEPYEHFKCHECTFLSENWTDHYNSYWGCPKHEERGHCYHEKACADFKPKYAVFEAYRICVLEKKVQELEDFINNKNQF